MKLKVMKNPKNNETVVDYYKVRDKETFRYHLIEKMMDRMDGDMTIYINTNQCLSKSGFVGIKEYLEAHQLVFKDMPTKAKETKMFGMVIDRLFNRNKEKPLEHLLVFEMTEEAWTEEFYQKHLKEFDLAIGFERQCEFYELCEQLLVQVQSISFNKDYFSAFVYDSIICTSVRASFDMEPYIQE